MMTHTNTLVTSVTSRLWEARIVRSQDSLIGSKVKHIHVKEKKNGCIHKLPLVAWV